MMCILLELLQNTVGNVINNEKKQLGIIYKTEWYHSFCSFMTLNSSEELWRGIVIGVGHCPILMSHERHTGSGCAGTGGQTKPCAVCLSVCHICGLRRYIILLEVGGTARRGFAYSAKIFWLVLFALTILLTSGWRIFQIQFLVYDKDHGENLSCAVCLPTNMVNEENTEMMVSFKRCTPHAKKIPGAKICYCRFY